jgi:hypothetical protein
VAERLENQGRSYLGTCFRSPLFAVLRNGFPLLFLLGTYTCSELKKEPRDHYHDKMDRKIYIPRVSRFSKQGVIELYGHRVGQSHLHGVIRTKQLPNNRFRGVYATQSRFDHIKHSRLRHVV